jgi:hypothetical protein
VSFSVTLSVNARLGERRPRVLRGMLPYGVRTFLWRALLLTSDHLPSRGTYHIAGVEKEGSIRNPGKQEQKAHLIKNFLLSCFPDSSLAANLLTIGSPIL